MSTQDERMTTADIAGTSSEPAESDADRPVGREDQTGETEGAGARAQGAELTPLFADEERTDLQQRWEALQTRFVDDPRTTVEEADQLVADLMQRLAESFAQERSSLEAQWSRGDDVSTEDLRVSLQRYRSFFERLLSA
jgi:hypothetical protein